MFVQRKWFRGVGNYFTSAPAASIDARSDGRFSGLILLVEFRTDADFYVVATLEECHGSPSFADEFKARYKKWLEDTGPDGWTPVAKAVSTQVVAPSPADKRGILQPAEA
jgi:hypothetical protein